jgi:hypothetical protein
MTTKQRPGQRVRAALQRLQKRPLFARQVGPHLAALLSAGLASRTVELVFLTDRGRGVLAGVPEAR